jgi:hypothetical protein
MTKLAPILVLVVLSALGPASASAVRDGSRDTFARPNAVAFGARTVGTTTVESVLIVNRGIARIQLGPLGIVDSNASGAIGAFGQSGGTCFQSETAFLDPGESCTVDVSFSPPLPGTFEGELLVAVDDFASSLGFDLRGTGIEHTIAYAPACHGGRHPLCKR